MSGRGRRRGNSNMRLVAFAVLVVVVLIALALGIVDLDDITGGGDTGDSSGSSGSSQTATIPPSGTSEAATPEEARDALDSLQVADSGSMSGYSRDEFPHWSNAGEFGWEAPDTSCDARDAALYRDGQNVEFDDGCGVFAGDWTDPYSGVRITDPSLIDIDHIVPLANAWRSGADEWDEPLREEFANAPVNLLSTDRGENRSKGDSGPEAWRPPDEGAWCDYSARWIVVKSDYELTVNPEEQAALEEMLATCETS